MARDYADIAKDKDVKALLSSMLIEEENPDISQIVKKYNLLADHSITWLAILRQRHHDFDGLLHSVKNMVTIIKDGHEELKQEHTLTRESTDNNTRELAKIYTIGSTSLWWLKFYGGISTVALIIGVGAAIFKWVVG